jgi:hypothetical protein
MSKKILNDPAGHFPYAYDRAVEAGLPKEQAELSRRVVEAQEAYLTDSSSENEEALAEVMREAQAAASKRRGDTVMITAERGAN